MSRSGDVIVIASEAKQSSSWRGELDCFVALAHRNDDEPVQPKIVVL
jgi:hypothetical protein